MSGILSRPQEQSFDVVIATRNRPEALSLSIPLILSQSRRPGKLIVIDSSDDHAAVAHAVEAAVQGSRTDPGWTGELILETAPVGLAIQRNLGLRHVTADIVFLPDDDSLFHPGTSEAIMRVYERDREGLIAGVCAVDAAGPPPAVADDLGYDMTASQKRQRATVSLRHRLERALTVLNPYIYIGAVLRDRFAPPDWMAAENCVAVEWMTGYRMTFRMSALGEPAFDTTMTGYSLGEDVDTSFAAMRHGLLVGAHGARIYHHKFPAPRGRAHAIAAKAVLNRCYITLKHAFDAGLNPRDAAKVRRLLTGFLAAKLLISLAKAVSREGRDGLRGVVAALGHVGGLRRASRAELPAVYAAASERVLGPP